MPELLKKAGVYTHLATDHFHYFEDGGATYHNRFSTWEFFRGQEGDSWRRAGGAESAGRGRAAAHSRGRAGLDQPGVHEERVGHAPGTDVCRGAGFYPAEQGFGPLVFADWRPSIRTSPYFFRSKYKDLYAEHYDAYKAKGGRPFDWPPYRKVEETPDEVEHCRYEYAALLSMCDAHLGKVLAMMDELDMWNDTMLIVCTDHGFMLGEHDCWAKGWQPYYNENAHVPL